MIHYALRCGDGHSFDGWFRSSMDFERQSEGGLLDCPVCARADVTRAIMAPRLSRNLAAPAIPEAAPPSPPVPGSEAAAPAIPPAPASAPPLPDQLRAVLQRIRAEVEQKCDYVGPRFAESARAIHAGEAPPRPIYGETTPDEAESLVEDGIEIARIPWVPRADG